MKYYTFIFLLSCGFSEAFAASFSCPNTFQTINTGDRSEDVRSRCGTPTSDEMRQIDQEIPTTIIHWTYTLRPLVNTNNLSANFLLASAPVMVISFKDHKVFDIKSNSAISNLFKPLTCSINGMLAIGDTEGTVQVACGYPDTVTSEPYTEKISKQARVWTYNFGPYQPQVILQFENDQLAQIETGSMGH